MSRDPESCTLELSNGRFIHVASTPCDAEVALFGFVDENRRVVKQAKFVSFQKMTKDWKTVRVHRDHVVAIHDLDKQSIPGDQNETRVEFVRPRELVHAILSAWSGRSPS